MRIRTNITNRRQLAQALAEHLEAEMIYMGPPTFAYKVGETTVERNGDVVGDDLTEVRAFLIERGFITEETPILELPDDGGEQNECGEDAVEQAIQEQGGDDLPISIGQPLGDMTAEQMRNLIHMLYSKQYILGRACGSETIRISDKVIEQLKDCSPVTTEIFKALMNGFVIEGEMEGVEFKEGAVYMTFPYAQAGSPDWEVYVKLMEHIFAAAKRATRVKAEVQRVENEKYFMRAWLLRLRFGSPQYKELRKRLMRNLNGHAAFATDAQAQAHREKYAEMRRIRRAVDEEVSSR